MAKAKKQATGGAKPPSPGDDLDDFDRRAAEASAVGIAARDKFVAKLRAVDPALVADFVECLNGMYDPWSALNAEMRAETNALRAGLPHVTPRKRGKGNG